MISPVSFEVLLFFVQILKEFTQILFQICLSSWKNIIEIKPFNSQLYEDIHGFLSTST